MVLSLDLQNFLLKNGKIVNGLLYSDGVHLAKDGTSLLINNINDKVGILKHKNYQNETPPKLTEIQQMQSKESFSQFEHKVFKSKLNGLIEVTSACSSSPFS
jgi:uncharacterized protein YfkK (UPF0435 family)